MQKKWVKEFSFFIFIALIILCYNYFGLNQFLSLENLKHHQENLNAYYLEHPLSVIGIFSLVYISSVTLSLPAATLFSLGAGALFGVALGSSIVLLTSSIGATFAFLLSRHFLKDWIEEKFKSKLDAINKGLKKEGHYYLLSLRLIPIFPFFLINLLLGLTSIPTMTYFWLTLVGMIPGTILYVNAGTQLAKIQTTKEILTPSIFISLVLLGLVPLVLKIIISWIKLHKNEWKFKKPRHFDYNMIVIGGGSAGLVSSYIASAVKAKVLLIEKNKMGGDCLNTGCVPSKAFIKSSKMAHLIKRSNEFGIESGNVKIDFKKVMERVQNVIKKIEPHDSSDRYTLLGVDCIEGHAQIISPYEIEVGNKIYTTRNIVIATGASPLIPQIPGLNEVSFLTSDTIWALRELPERLVVLGGGPIGCELALSFSRLGSKITIIERSSHLLSKEDEDVSELVRKNFENENIKILTHHKILRIDPKEKKVICECEGREVQIHFDEVLIALGRKANVSGFGLEKLGIDISETGQILADQYLRTTHYPNIFVCGDVTGPYQFTHTAAHQAWYVAVNALFGIFRKFKVDYSVIPWCTFIDPEVARVGLNEKEAKEKNIRYEVSQFFLEELDRAITEGEDYGFIKVLTVPGKDKILGVTIVGEHAGEIIAEYVTAMRYGIGMNKILRTIHVYPTMAETNKYVAGVWKKKDTSKKNLKWLSRFHAFRR